MTQTAHGVEFTQQPSATPKSAEERAAILANPGFGDHFTDHTAVVDYTVDASGQGGWHDARIERTDPSCWTRPPLCCTTGRKSSRV
jgi:branched-chain amino acid aminotransferase